MKYFSCLHRVNIEAFLLVFLFFCCSCYRQISELEMQKKQNLNKLNRLKAETRNLESHITALHTYVSYFFLMNFQILSCKSLSLSLSLFLFRSVRGRRHHIPTHSLLCLIQGGKKAQIFVSHSHLQAFHKHLSSQETSLNALMSLVSQILHDGVISLQ